MINQKTVKQPPFPVRHQFKYHIKTPLQKDEKEKNPNNFQSFSFLAFSLVDHN
jgi:hypothetical protein